MPDDEQGQTESGKQQEKKNTDTTTGASVGKVETLGESGMRALERERDARKEAERKLKEVTETAEREKLSAQQRAEKERDAALKEAEQVKLEAMRFRIGLKAGVPVDHLDRIQGTTEDDIRADAEQYAKSLGQQAGGLGGGARGSEAPKDMNALIRRAAGRGPA